MPNQAGLGQGPYWRQTGLFHKRFVLHAKKGDKKDLEIRRGMSFVKGLIPWQLKENACLVNLQNLMGPALFLHRALRAFWAKNRREKIRVLGQNLLNFAAFKEPLSSQETPCFVNIASAWTS